MPKLKPDPVLVTSLDQADGMRAQLLKRRSELYREVTQVNKNLQEIEGIRKQIKKLQKENS